MARAVDQSLQILRRIIPSRVSSIDYVRYRKDLTDAIPESVAEVTRVTEAHIARLRLHPTYGSNPRVSGFRLWDHGLRTALIWEDGGEPLCIQWLFTSSDSELLRTYPEWSGLYPPLATDTAQVENLFSFAFARPGGAATEFMFGVFRLVRTMGIRTVFTHILASNWPAHRWAERTGWQRHGTIRRWSVDLPVIRRFPLCVHEAG